MKKSLSDSENRINHPFKVEDGYFENLETRIIDLKNETKPSTYVSFSLKHAIAIGTMCILLVVSWTYFFQRNTSEYNQLLAEVSTDEILTYLEDYDLSSEEMVVGFGVDILDPDQIENDLDQIDFDQSTIDELYFEIEIDNQLDI